MDDLKLRARSCVSCKFFEPPMPGNAMGECHRFPVHTTPVLLGMMPPSAEGEPAKPIFHNVISVPLTPETYWCGEHKPKLNVH